MNRTVSGGGGATGTNSRCVWELLPRAWRRCTARTHVKTPYVPPRGHHRKLIIYFRLIIWGSRGEKTPKPKPGLWHPVRAVYMWTHITSGQSLRQLKNCTRLGLTLPVQKFFNLWRGLLWQLAKLRVALQIYCKLISNSDHEVSQTRKTILAGRRRG